MKKLRQKWKHHLTLASAAMKLSKKPGASFLMGVLAVHHTNTAVAIRQQIQAQTRKVKA